MIAEQANILPTSDGHHDRADLAMLRRAIRRRWPIKPELKALALAAIEERLADGDRPDLQIAAAKTLATMEGQNLQADIARARVGEGNMNTGIVNNVVVKVEFDKAG